MQFGCMPVDEIYVTRDGWWSFPIRRKTRNVRIRRWRKTAFMLEVSYKAGIFTVYELRSRPVRITEFNSLVDTTECIAKLQKRWRF